jgi:hypothetical protein
MAHFRIKTLRLARNKYVGNEDAVPQKRTKMAGADSFICMGGIEDVTPNAILMKFGISRGPGDIVTCA